jgi:hypothetical protein
MMNPAWKCSLCVCVLAVSGCAGMVKKTRFDAPQAPVSASSSQDDLQGLIAAVVKTELSAAMNLNTGPITGVNYQSVLPMGMVILLTVIVLTQTASNSFEDWLLHRQQMVRLKANGGPR